MSENNSRPSWKSYFTTILEATALRSSCLSDKKGALIVKNQMVVSTGYSGAPRGVEPCVDKGVCYKRSLGYGHGQGHEFCLAVHAEANAILNAARNGISTEGCEMYCTHKPCENCIKMIIQSGITKVYYLHDYQSPTADNYITETGIVCEQL